MTSLKIGTSPSKEILAWSQQEQHEGKVWNKFNVNINEIRTTTKMHFDSFIVNFEHISQLSLLF